MDWLLKHLIGDLPVTSPVVAKLPIIDDKPSLSQWKPSAAAERLFQRLELERTVKAIFDDDQMAKAVSIEAFDNRTLQDDTQPKQPTSYPDLPQAIDPRKKQCDCDCPFCRTQNCKNCDANPRCEFAALEGPLSDILPVDAEMRQAAKAHQQKRFDGDRLRKHKRALLPMVQQFRKALWPKPSVSVDQAVAAVVTAAAQYVTSAVACEF